MLVGKIMFVIALCGLTCQLAAFGMTDWQRAGGNVRLGLWRQCNSVSCTDSELALTNPLHLASLGLAH